MQNQKQRLDEIGVDVVVIAGQKRESVKNWLNKHPCPFPFLVDETRAVIKAFHVYKPLGVDSFRIASPSLFFISPGQRIVFAYVGKNQFDRPDFFETYEKVKNWLKKVNKE